MRIPCLLLGLAAVLAGCTTAPPQPRSAQSEQYLQSLLGGKVAGTARSCLPAHLTRNMVVVDQHTILFNEGGRVWRSDLRGACSLVGSSNYAIVTQGLGFEGPCSGQVFQLADLSSGMTMGSCVWGDFVPYTTARR